MLEYASREHQHEREGSVRNCRMEGMQGCMLQAPACITGATAQEGRADMEWLDGGMHAPACITGATAREGRADVELLDGGDAYSSMHHCQSDSMRRKGRFGVARQRGCILEYASQE
jgi:hypothetical protein